MHTNRGCPCESLDFMKEGGSGPGHDSRRSVEEIRAALSEIEEKVWLDRHRMLMEGVGSSGRAMDPKIKASAEEAARRIEAKYPPSELGPYTDFEWVMLNGKLSALRWVLGSDSCFLDT